MSSEGNSADGVDGDLWRSMMIASFPDPICVRDSNGGVVLINQRFADVFRVSPEHALGKTDYDLFSKELAETRRHHHQTAIERPGRVQWDEFVELEDGPHSFLWNEFPIRGKDNNVVGVGSLAIDVTGGTDISERQRLAGRLRSAEERCRAILSSLKSPIVMIDRVGVIVTANEAWIRFARENGISDLQRLSPGANYFDVCPRVLGETPNAERALRGIQEVLDGIIEEFALEFPVHGPDRERWLELSVAPLKQGSGGAVICHSEVTRRVQVEQELKRSDEYYHALIDNALDMVGIVRQDGTLAYTSQAVRRNLGYAPEELIGKDVLELVHPEDRSGAAQAIERALSQPGTPQRVEYRYRHKDGSWRFIESIGVGAIDNPALRGIVASSRDNTTLREKELALEKTNAQLQALAARVLVAEEQERRRISRELHDDLNQNLAILAVDVGACIKQARSADLQSRLRTIQQSIADLSESIRRMAHQLHPAMLDDLGITIALRSYCEEFARRQDMSIRFIQRDVPADLLPAVRTALYRITQEALWNIAKHAQTRRAVVAITGGPGCVRLRVRDWGVGFDPASKRDGRGLGLISMEERARIVGGEFVITSRPGKGTRVTVEIPVTTAAP